MAPTKKDAIEKEVKLTADQSASLVLEYLRKQNRPYSATDISANLKNRVTKAAAAKLLKDLHERQQIEGRAAGKQIVYHAIQNENDDTSPENLQTIEAETTRLRNETAAYKAQEKDLRAELREDAGRISLPELKASIAELEGDKAELIARLTKVKSGDVKPVHAEERTRINDEHRKWQKIAAARSKIRAELWKEIASIVGSGKAEDTKEELGLEF